MTPTRALVLALAFFIHTNLLASPLSAIRVAPGIYAFIGDTGPRTLQNEGMNANAGFVVTSAGVLLIDSGSTTGVAEAMARQIARLTPLPVRWVINTGGQDHRWLGNAYFRKHHASVYASMAATDDIVSRGPAQLVQLKALLGPRASGTEISLPETRLATLTEVVFGGHRIQLIPTNGGHTPGDMLVWIPDQRVLFTGDLVFTDRLLGILPVSNTRRWLESFSMIESLKPKIIVPGHGRIATLKAANEQTKAYLTLLRTHMAAALKNGTDLQSAVETLDQSRFKHLPLYSLLAGPNANRVYLEMEQE